MALALSTRSGQVPSVCDFCEKDPNIKYKCFDCNLLLCQKCRDKIHAKIKNSDRHKIVDIKDIGNEIDMDFTNIKCEDHSAFCCLFCESCDQLVCPTCLARDHKSHDLTEISDGYEEKLEEILEIQDRTEKALSSLRIVHRNLEQFKYLQNVKISTEEKKIEDHRNMLQRALDVHIERLTSDLKNNTEEILQAVNKDINTLQQVEENAQAKYDEVLELTNTNDSNKFFKDISKIEYSDDFSAPRTPSVLMSTPIFVPKDVNLADIGELQRNSNSEISCDLYNLQITKQYQSMLDGIEYACHCTEDSLWLGSGTDTALQLVRPENNKLEVISTINTEVYGMASIKTGELLISNGTTKLQQISYKFAQLNDARYDVAPLTATSLHTTNEGKILVGGIDQDRGTVFLFDKDGKLERAYEHTKHGQPIFTYAASITSTSNGNIHVADCIPGDRGRLVVIAEGGEVINIYSGHLQVNELTPFRPSAVATTPADNVMVVDLQIEYLHLLDNTGQLLTTIDTHEAGIRYPHSLAFTSSGSFWIGCSTSVDSKVKNAKLYLVNLQSI